MNQKFHNIITGLIFGIVAILHLLRIVFHSEILVSSHVIPMWLSYGGLIVPGVLCVWSFKLVCAGTKDIK